MYNIMFNMRITVVSLCGLMMLKMVKVKKNQEIDSNIVGFCLFMDILKNS